MVLSIEVMVIPRSLFFFFSLFVLRVHLSSFKINYRKDTDFKTLKTFVKRIACIAYQIHVSYK